MDTNRSFLDNLNAGRKRRSGTALEHISRTLQEIEKQLDRAYARPSQQPGESTYPEDDARRQAVAAAPAPRPTAEAPLHERLSGVAAGFERARTGETGLASMETIASEVKSLRDELQTRHDGMRREFETLRDELKGVGSVSGAVMSESDVAGELERLSSAVAALGERGDERTLHLLRLDMEQLRGALDVLAREETVRTVGRRWEEMAAGGVDDAAVEALASRLDHIAGAVADLPDTRALRSLDEKVRMLAGALDQFIEHSSQSRPDLYELIDERLDEISRAIAATAAAAKAPQFDTAPLERIEARVASLARQVEEVVEESQSAELVERLAALGAKVDEIAARVEEPDPALEQMSAQIAAISRKVEQAVGAADPEALYSEIDRRFAGLSEMVASNHGEALEHGQRLFEEVRAQIGALASRVDSRADAIAPDLLAAFEGRFDELAARIEAQAGDSADDQAMAAMEARLEELTLRLKDTFDQAAALDPQIVRQLQKQIGDLAEHLARPGEALPDFEDMGPRLARIELSLAENRESMVEAARQAAQDTLASLRGTVTEGDGAVDLSSEIRALENLARRSDDRNARTFEAIHDTLLKIVERLSSLEAGGEEEMREPVKLALGEAPSLDPHDQTDEELGDMPAAAFMADATEPETAFAAPEPIAAPQKLSPAEAAAAAAEAALSDQAPAEPTVVPGKRSMLGGLTRAFSHRREREAAASPARKEPAVAAENASLPAEPAIEPEHLNEPLEPGSGAPDLNAIMRRVRDEAVLAPRHSEGDAAKADFIAAARRAAQAAAAEAETLKRKKGGEARGSGGRFGVGGLLRSRKSTALMAVAGIAIAASGVGAARLLMDNGHEHAKLVALAKPVSAKSSATATPKVEPAAAKAADTVTGAALPAAAAADAAADKAASVAKAETAAASPAQAAAAASDATAVTAGTATASAEAPPAPQKVSYAPADEKPAAAAPAMPQDAQPAAEVEAPASKLQEDTPTDLAALPAAIGPQSMREAAAKGDAKALFAIADRYAEGKGVEADSATAARYYEQAAAKGLAPAQYRIGNDYEKGIGVDRDVAKAKDWYRKAAEQGNASAMHNLGVLYAMGANGDADNEEAARWFSKAAELGVKDSQFNLGILSAKGVGVKKDLGEAYKWFALLAEAGDKDAAGKRDEIAKVLDAEALKQAKASTALWKAKPMERTANVVDLPAEWTQDKMTTASVDMKKAVTNIQLILNKNGYGAGPADGVMGDKTRQAIAAFQKDNGLDATGKVDSHLVEALLARN